MILNRRLLLHLAGIAALTGTGSLSRAQAPPGLVELGSDTIVSTARYSGQLPGPLVRLTEGVRLSRAASHAHGFMALFNYA